DFQPASTLKLLVGSAALDRLGPAFRFRTTLGLAPAAHARAPALVLRMGGDPTLTFADLSAAVDASPVPSISNFFVDDSAFEDRHYPAGWTWDDFGQDYAPPVSAATLDENVVTVRVSPGARAGAPASVRVANERAAIAQSASCNAHDASVVALVSVATTGAAGSDDTLDVARTPNDCPEVIGSIPLGAAPESLSAAVYDPLAAIAATLNHALSVKKIVVTQPNDAFARPVDALVRPPATLPARTAFWTHDSQPLSELLGPRFWIPSDNLFGELLLEELGLASRGTGSTGTGIAAEKTWLASLGIDPATVTLADGCGMSQYDRITPRDLVAILQHDFAGPNRAIVLDSLPIGGVRGTIEGIAGTLAQGRVYAKTGSMMHVRGLAGYLVTQRHGAVTFAFNVDDWIGDYAALATLRAAVLARIIAD
ncbi:MAG: D-alanyl-D-alanine carboxypeptidase/D-alanyl-D-alanine-endopeptidase, partial [Candidatus Eremiobacteraeota bacterium]|nr:D-alanyl-D-alanine carboxypeptidase/D-alanyl-D-alanine-endopeptidase [Candidatus Eremiobacteraeota bacterium]